MKIKESQDNYKLVQPLGRWGIGKKEIQENFQKQANEFARDIFIKELADVIEAEAQELSEIHINIANNEVSNRKYYEFLKKGLITVAHKAIGITLRENIEL